MNSVIYRSDHVEVHFRNRGGSNLLVTFNEMGLRADGRSIWGNKLAERLDLSIIGFVSSEPNWFPSADMHRAVEVVHARTSGLFQRRIGLGLSQGAYAVLRYGRDLAIDEGVAFSPQCSIDKSDITDPRFNRYFNPALHAGMRLHTRSFPNLAVIIFDPYDARDSEHVSLIGEGVNVLKFPVPGIGHGSAKAYANTELMRRLFNSLRPLDLSGMRSVNVVARRRAPQRPFAIAMALKRAKARTKLGIFLAYRDRIKQAPWWALCYQIAEAGLGQAVSDWVEMKADELIHNAEVQGVASLVAIRNRDQNAALIYARRAVELDPLNERWLWILRQAQNLGTSVQ